MLRTSSLSYFKGERNSHTQVSHPSLTIKSPDGERQTPSKIEALKSDRGNKNPRSSAIETCKNSGFLFLSPWATPTHSRSTSIGFNSIFDPRCHCPRLKRSCRYLGNELSFQNGMESLAIPHSAPRHLRRSQASLALCQPSISLPGGFTRCLWRTQSRVWGDRGNR